MEPKVIRKKPPQAINTNDNINFEMDRELKGSQNNLILNLILIYL